MWFQNPEGTSALLPSVLDAVMSGSTIQSSWWTSGSIWSTLIRKAALPWGTVSVKRYHSDVRLSFDTRIGVTAPLVCYHSSVYRLLHCGHTTKDEFDNPFSYKTKQKQLTRTYLTALSVSLFWTSFAKLLGVGSFDLVGFLSWRTSYVPHLSGWFRHSTVYALSVFMRSSVS